MEQPYYKTHVIGHFAIKPLIYVLSTLLVVSVMNDVVQVAITETLRAELGNSFYENAGEASTKKLWEIYF